MTAANQNSRCILKELYKREIGLHNNQGKWSRRALYEHCFPLQKLYKSRDLIGHRLMVNYIDFNNTGNILLSVSEDLSIRLWDYNSGNCTFKHKSDHFDTIIQAIFMKNQGDIRIVSSGRDGLLILLTVSSSTVYSKIISQDCNYWTKLAVHPDLPFEILSCGIDGIIKNTDIRESGGSTNIVENVRNYVGDCASFFNISINPMKSFEFIASGNTGSVYLYDKRRISNCPVKQYQHRTSMPVTSAIYNFSGNKILASCVPDEILLFDVNGPPNTILHRYTDPRVKHMSLRREANFYGPESEYVVGGSYDGFLFIWDKQTEAIVEKKNSYTNEPIYLIKENPYMPSLASCGSTNIIKIWESQLLLNEEK